VRSASIGDDSYGELLEVFFAIHDPHAESPGHDSGTQYRSELYSSRAGASAAATIAALEAGHVFGAPIVTEVLPASTFYQPRVSPGLLRQQPASAILPGVVAQGGELRRIRRSPEAGISLSGRCRKAYSAQGTTSSRNP